MGDVYLDRGMDGMPSSWRALGGSGDLPCFEAKAMVETWHGAWFEEGTRLLYLVPRPTIDAVLPLSIYPTPDEIVRAFVGRVELITPTTLSAVEGAIANDDVATLKLFGRFVMPIVNASQPSADTLDRRLAPPPGLLVKGSQPRCRCACPAQPPRGRRRFCRGDSGQSPRVATDSR
jgi:hypothetical protein